MLVALSTPTTNDRGPQYMDQALEAIHHGNPERLPFSLEIRRIQESVTLACRFPEDLRPVSEGRLT